MTSIRNYHTTFTDDIFLYIKRAEIKQTEQYIRETFTRLVGDVGEIVFTERVNATNGAKYHSAIVHIDRLIDTSNVSKLLHDVTKTDDKSTRLVHPMGYWIVTQHHPKSSRVKAQQMRTASSDLELPDSKLDPSERIRRLEDIVKMLNTELGDSREKIDKYSRICMDYENQHTSDWMENFKLKSRLEDAELHICDLCEQIETATGSPAVSEIRDNILPPSIPLRREEANPDGALTSIV